MKTVLAAVFAVLVATELQAGEANFATDVSYPARWSQPQVLPNGTVVPPVPTRFETRSVGIQFQPIATAAPAPVNANGTNSVALILAADRGDLNAVKALLAKKADVNVANVHGATALMAAAAGGHVEITKLLLEKGAEVNEVTGQGKTALIYACAKGHGEIVQLLLAKNADPKVMDETGKMAIDYATAGNYLEIIQLLKGEPSAKK